MLLLDVAQLVQQAFPQIAAGDTWWVELANNLQCFVQFAEGECRFVNGARGWSRGGDRLRGSLWGRCDSGRRGYSTQLGRSIPRSIPSSRELIGNLVRFALDRGANTECLD